MDDDKALKLLDHIGRELKLLWGQLEVWQELFDVEQEKRQTLIGTAPVSSPSCRSRWRRAS